MRIGNEAILMYADGDHLLRDVDTPVLRRSAPEQKQPQRKLSSRLRQQASISLIHSISIEIHWWHAATISSAHCFIQHLGITFLPQSVPR